MSLFDDHKRSGLINRINQLTPENKALWGKMNVNQMICHTTDQLRLAFGDIKRDLQNAPFIKRTLIKWLALYVISIPKNVPTLPEADQLAGGGTKPTDFVTDKATLLHHIENFTIQADDFRWGYHGAFGQLNRKEWGILAYKHLDHHLKQFGV
jgi:hypothetical protein